MAGQREGRAGPGAGLPGNTCRERELSEAGSGQGRCSGRSEAEQAQRAQRTVTMSRMRKTSRKKPYT